MSELFTEEFMKEAIKQCAEEEGLKLMREITSKNTFNGNKFYNIKYVIQLSYVLFLVHFSIKINIYLFWTAVKILKMSWCTIL